MVEVADATLRRDRGLKQRLYAKSGIVAYWILNLIDQQLEVYTKPSSTDENAAYQQRTIYQRTDAVPLVIGGQEIAQLKVSDLLP